MKRKLSIGGFQRYCENNKYSKFVIKNDKRDENGIVIYKLDVMFSSMEIDPNLERILLYNKYSYGAFNKCDCCIFTNISCVYIQENMLGVTIGVSHRGDHEENIAEFVGIL